MSQGMTNLKAEIQGYQPEASELRNVFITDKNKS